VAIVLCGGFYGDVDFTSCGRRGGVVSGRLVLTVMTMMMGHMVVQEAPEITKRTGGMFGGLGQRKGMLLRRELVGGWRRRGVARRDRGLGQRMAGSTTREEAELGGHEVMLCRRGARLRRTTWRP